MTPNFLVCDIYSH